jgi:hypothetical protein
MIVSISEAARLAGKSRTTLYRMLDSGDLSSVTGVDSQPGIDVSELLRVFPGIRVQAGVQNERPPVQVTEQSVTPQMDSQLYRSLQAHIAALERVIEAKDAVIAEKDARLLLLTDQRPAEAVAAPVATEILAAQISQPPRRRTLLDRLADGITAALK